MTATNKNSNDGAIENANEVIERFGGIRPMSKKIDVAVTTIQGWKKRNVIPSARRSDILKAAERYKVDLSDLAEGTDNRRISNENTSRAAMPTAPTTPRASKSQALPLTRTVEDEFEAEINQKIQREIRVSEGSAVRKSTWISGSLVLLASVGMIVLLFPQNKKISENEARIAYVETQMREGGGGESMFSNLIPKSLQDQLGALQDQAYTIQSRIANISEQAESVSRTLTSPNSGNLAHRIERIEAQLGTLASEVTANIGVDTDLSVWFQKLQAMQNSDVGRVVLDNSVMDMSAILAALGIQSGADVAETPELEQALSDAQQENDALGEVLQGVNGDDLKAAALLLGLTQFRNALHREGGFADDLALMQSMVGGDENSALNEALLKLAPQAQDGILSPQRLSAEFKGLAGDIVVSSLKGEDVSVQEKAKARLNEVLEIKKDGELITGTDTQARVARAQVMLDEGNIQGAIDELQSLDGDAAGTAKPWIEEAKATLLARDAEGMLTNEIIGKLKNMGGSVGSVVNGGGVGTKVSYSSVIQQLKSFAPSYKMHRDKATGYSFMVPETHTRAINGKSLSTGQ